LSRETKKKMKNSGYEYHELIHFRDCGSSVLTYLTLKYRHSSRDVWRERIERGEIFLDGHQVRRDTVLKAGRRLIWRRPPWEEPDVPLTFSIIHEDTDLLAVAKPSGLPTMPAGGFLDHTLLTLVRKRWSEATPVHRLGRGTSGVVLFARTARARSILGATLRNNEITRIYRALATGVPCLQMFTVDAPIGPVSHSKLGTIHSACAGGRPAFSRVRVLEKRGDTSLLEVAIETGRPHQIRIHLAFAGHPLVGDPIYASGAAIRNQDALPGDCGYLLHAERLCFSHPGTKSELEIICPPPPELVERR
jgi:23S rRNA pseudouridine1911/1915/1917 synthase